ncbi:MAG: hypothetical protein IKV94_04240 [Clostridia bacterium]|nr:hypothetical protein [Clostridia bacterium]
MEKEINKYSAVFSGQELKLEDEEFNGGVITAVFGGVDLDLCRTVITKDVEIKARCFFGGIDIILPEDINVEVTSFALFGGVTNKKSKKNKSDKNTVTVRIVTMFGGVDIK